jgi:hypothetical protein
MTIELLTPARAAFLWVQMQPLLEQSCQSNEVGITDITTGDIYRLLQSDQAVAFVGFTAKKVTTVLVIQFNLTNGNKGADVIAMAGKNLLKFKALFWAPILDWLRANGVKYVDAYATPQLARIYQTRFGFDRSCVMVRMTLEEKANEQGG